MKKGLLIHLIVGTLMVWGAAASAEPKAQQQGGVTTQQSGVQDKRIITPQMNYRERLEAQRAIQKRAAANRSALMQQAAEQEKQKAAEQVKKQAETSDLK